MATPVIFRKWPESEGGGIDAILPTFPGTADPYTCTFYARVGQHSSGDPVSVIQRTKSATPAEYADLMDELKSIGYDDLVVYRRLQQDFLEERKQALRLLSKPTKKKTAKKKSRKSHPATTSLRSIR